MKEASPSQASSFSKGLRFTVTERQDEVANLLAGRNFMVINCELERELIIILTV
jgi:hypothetical protein